MTKSGQCYNDHVMIDVFTRALRHPIAYSGICRITSLTFQEKIHETGDIYSFIFTANHLPSWKAGQHSIFALPRKSVEGRHWRPFSVASSPREGLIRIGTIISTEPSSFKQHLANLQPGDTVRMFGPYGELYVRPGVKKVVGIAGGIGITPFRSIMADLTEKHSPTELTLIYSARDNQYAFREELETWCQQNSNLKIIYTATPEEVNAELDKQLAALGNEAQYFLSGPPKMIEDLRGKIKNSGILTKNILNDPFKGY